MFPIPISSPNYDLYKQYASAPPLAVLEDHHLSNYHLALQYALLHDKAVFPVSAKKTPLTGKGFKDASRDPEQIKSWWKSHRGALVGLPTGTDNRLFVLDIDKKNGVDGEVTLTALETDFGHLQPSLASKTPSGGFHFYYNLEAGTSAPSSAGTAIGEGLDVRCEGGYVVAAGSYNATGSGYEIITDTEDLNLLPTPSWLLTKASGGSNKNAVGKTKREPVLQENKIIEGTRNQSIFRLLATNYAKGLTDLDQLTALGHFINEKLCTVPLSNDEVERIAQGICERYSPTYSLDWMGVAERMSDLYSKNLKCVRGKDWFVYANGIYKSGSAGEYAKTVARDVQAEAQFFKDSLGNDASEQDYDTAKAFLTFARKVRDNPLNMLSLAAIEPAITVSEEQFDSVTSLVNCSNTAYDLDAMVAVPHSPAQLFRKSMNVAYDPAATCPTFDEFILWAMDDDVEMVAYLARLFGGVGLVGGNPEQIFLILLGTGKNGKSVFVDVMSYMFSSYYDVIRQDVLTVTLHNNVRHDVAEMSGARFLLASELMPGAKLNGALLKMLTGGDTIKGRKNYQDSVSFQCEALIAIQTNWRPEIQSGDYALKRRIKLIEFVRTVEDSKCDPMLTSKLRGEAAGIFNWLLRGREEYLASGIKHPTKVIEATNRFYFEMDWFEQFFAECCVEDANAETSAQTMQYACQRFTMEAGFSFNQQQLSQIFVKRGFKRVKKNSGYVYKGVKLK